jgi:hypothetical protein
MTKLTCTSQLGSVLCAYWRLPRRTLRPRTNKLHLLPQEGTRLMAGTVEHLSLSILAHEYHPVVPDLRAARTRCTYASRTRFVLRWSNSTLRRFLRRTIFDMMVC